MFKSLLRTTPLLTGNISLNCKVVDYTKKENGVYVSEIRYADLCPLQSYFHRKPINTSLLSNTWDMDVARFYDLYKDIFYEKNYSINEEDYQIANDMSYNEICDRNKDYEFGCKRTPYGFHGFECNFFAPIYCDNVEDLPYKFCIDITYDDNTGDKKNNGTLNKKIEILINNNSKYNYLYIYLKKYLSKIDNKVIYLNNYSKTGFYYGIEVTKGGLCALNDNIIGTIYNNQTTINDFDKYICEGFKRNNLICRQIIPLAFSFNLDSILTNKEKKYLKNKKCHITGYYKYSNNIECDLYDFNIDYYNYTYKKLLYNDITDEITLGNSNNIIDTANNNNYTLGEKRLKRYKYFNKIDCLVNKWEIISSTQQQYLINNHNIFTLNYLYPSSITHGETKCYCLTDNNVNLILPVFKYNTNNTNFDKSSFKNIILYRNNMKLTLLENYSNWINTNNIISNFTKNENYDNIQYVNVTNNKIIYNGVLYNFENEITEGPINKFAIIIDICDDGSNISFQKMDNTNSTEEDKKINNKEAALLYIIKIPKNYITNSINYNIENYNIKNNGNKEPDIVQINNENIFIVTKDEDGNEIKNINIDIIKKYFIYLNVFLKEKLFIKFISFFNTIITPQENTIKQLYNITNINTIGTEKDNVGIFYSSDDNNKDVYELNIIKKNNLYYPIIRYFDYIIPAFNNISKNNHKLENRFHLYYKDKTISKTFEKNNIYNKEININKYDPIKYMYIDDILHTDSGKDQKYNFEYKHFLDNVIFNLEKNIEIKYDGDLLYNELLIQENKENSFNVFKNYMKKYINIKNEDNIYLFLYNKYKLNFLSTPKYNNMNGDKMYELIYKFTLI